MLYGTIYFLFAVCPLFKGAIAKGFGHICTVHDDCMGIVCSVPFKIKAKEDHLKVNVTVILDRMAVEITINDKTLLLETDGMHFFILM